MVKRIYVDNSVIGGRHDSEFSKHTERLFYEFRLGLYIPVVSEVTEDEIQGAPAEVKKTFNELADISEYVELSGDAIKLADQYIKDGKFTRRMLFDTLHIACATVNRIDILVSWNFRDIVNLNKIVIYDSVNIKNGYSPIQIRNPREVLHE